MRRVIQASARRSPAWLVGNSPLSSRAPVVASTTAKMWVAAWVSTPTSSW